VARWLVAGLAYGLVVSVVLHDTRLVGRLTGWPLPARLDPLTRVRGWRATGEVVEQERRKLEAEGTPVFLIGAHYGITSLLSFYIPEVKARVKGEPLAYYLKRASPENQFFFWPSYEGRKGQTALYVGDARKTSAPPPELERQFESVTLWGTVPVVERGRKVRELRLYACRGLR
jgi:hypothetical protein